MKNWKVEVKNKIEIVQADNREDAQQVAQRTFGAHWSQVHVLSCQDQKLTQTKLKNIYELPNN